MVKDSGSNSPHCFIPSTRVFGYVTACTLNILVALSAATGIRIPTTRRIPTVGMVTHVQTARLPQWQGLTLLQLLSVSWRLPPLACAFTSSTHCPVLDSVCWLLYKTRRLKSLDKDNPQSIQTGSSASTQDRARCSWSQVSAFQHYSNLVRRHFKIDLELKANFWKACSEVFLTHGVFLRPASPPWPHPEQMRQGPWYLSLNGLPSGDALMFEVILIWKKRSIVCPGVRLP